MAKVKSLELLFFPLAITLYLFLTPSVCDFLGIQSVELISSALILLLIGYFLFNRQIAGSLRSYLPEASILILSCCLIMVYTSYNDIDSIRTVFFLFIVPIFLFIVLLESRTYDMRVIKVVLFLFFFSECSLAITERAFEFNFFSLGSSEEVYVKQFGEFRSTSLLGHPLNNALSVSLMLCFYASSDIGVLKKLLILLLGFVALLAFNARAGSIIWALLILYIYVKSLASNKLHQHMRIILSITGVIGFIAISFLILDYGFGGRLINNDILDGSAMTRVEVFDVFDMMTIEDFLIGNPSNYAVFTRKLGASGVENSYIVMIIRYGIIFSVGYLIAYFFWFRSLVASRSRDFQIFLIIGFIVLGSTNNGLLNNAPWKLLVVYYPVYFGSKHNLYM